MFSIHPPACSPNLNFDGLKWVINIRRTLEANDEDVHETPVCIFSVPKPLISTDPDSYNPQQVAVGPYHCLRRELYEMEREKLRAARNVQKRFETRKLDEFVEKVKESEQMIRACYNKYLEINGETLAWMMAVDASFLVEFLQVYGVREGESSSQFFSRKSGHNEIVKDIVKLENQIPLFVLRNLLGFQFSSMETADCVLISMLVGFYHEISPFQLIENDSSVLQVSNYAHVLDFIYQNIVPEIQEQSEIEIEEEEDDKEDESNNSKRPGRVLREFMGFIKRISSSKPARYIAVLPWRILSCLPGFAVLKVSTDYLFSRQENGVLQDNANPETSRNFEKSPLVEEIMIPSVSDLYSSGIRFKPINGNIFSISFDYDSGTLYLPIVTLDINTEVVLRNLVAYEAANTYRPLVFTRYTELMNGIIDSEHDIRLLREHGVVKNRMKSDGEAADLWNGMSKSLRLTKVPFLDKVIEDVNRYYSGRWRVKIGIFVSKYVYGSWQILAFLAAVLLLLLLSLHLLSSIFSPLRLFTKRPEKS